MCIVYRRFANVLFDNVLSRFAYVLGQLPNCFRLISGGKNEISYICIALFRIVAERARYISERDIGETTSWAKRSVKILKSTVIIKKSKLYSDYDPISNPLSQW